VTKTAMIERLVDNDIIPAGEVARYEALTEEEVREIHDQHLDGGLTATEFRRLMQEAIAESIDFQAEQASTRSFEEEGVLTMNEGLTVRLPTGAEFQITIVRSR
jgi:hypothetical protein